MVARQHHITRGTLYTIQKENNNRQSSSAPCLDGDKKTNEKCNGRGRFQKFPGSDQQTQDGHPARVNAESGHPVYEEGRMEVQEGGQAYILPRG